jgi:predicted MFS family arabinose efflux permease
MALAGGELRRRPAPAPGAVAPQGGQQISGRNLRWEEWRRNWTLVLACAFGFSFSSVINYAFGLFIEPLGTEFGWNRAQVSLGLSISSLLSVLISPLIGILIDRWGVRRLAVPGLLLLALSMSSFALANGSLTQWLALWAIFAIIDLSVKSTVWTTAVVGAFDRERSLAIAFTLGGVSLCQIIAPPLAQALIAGFGWRVAFIALGAGWGSVALLLAWLFLYDARGRNRRAGRHDAAPARREVHGLTLRAALASVPLLRIGAATFLTMLLGIAVLVHQVPILTAGGITRQHAAYIASLGGIAGIAGKFTTGWLMDRKDPGTVGASILALSALAYGLLLDRVRSVPLAIVAIVVTGFAAATKLQICAYMTSQYAGMRNFGAIFGIMSSLIALGSGIGPLLAGAVFDAWGTYDPLIIASVIGTLLAAALIARLGRYPVPDRTQPVINPP